jgi:hypothetical protein
MVSTVTHIGHNHLIQISLSIFEKALVTSFEVAITDELSNLFHKAEAASSNQQELEIFEQYNQLRKENDKLIKFLRETTKKMPDALIEFIKVAEDYNQLTLVEDEELEVTLALTQIESVLSSKFINYLFALEKRIKVLFASRKVTKTNMPFGATSICWILSQTLEKATFSLRTKTSILKLLTKELIKNFEEAYWLIDEQFVKAKILPNIKLKTKIAKEKPAPQKQAHEYDQEVEAFQEALNNTVKGEAKPYQEHTGVYKNKSINLVSSIFSMMNQTQSGQQSTNTSNIDNPTMDHALDNLSKISNVAAGVEEIDKLKEMILDDVRNETGIFYPSLTQRQHNSMDIMGMFYDHVKQDVNLDSNMLSSLNAINIPLIRTAVTDETFFDDDRHPAREFLEKLIFAAQKWHGTSVVKNLHKFSANVANDYDGTTASFKAANDDVESYLRLTERRSKNSEEKWINAAKGKEKLEASRQIVREIVDNVSDIAVPDFVKSVMKYVVQDALTLTLLRHGEDSKEWHSQIETSTILAKMANSKEVKELTPKQKIESLHQLDQTMDELGFSDNDRHKTINNFKECAIRAAKDDLDKDIVLTEVASIKKGDVIKTANQREDVKIEELRELTHEERMELTKIKLLPYGTLFDFIINQQRETIRRKLSWFSPVSNRALFVSLLGNKPHDRTLNSLAIDINRKNIIIVKLDEKKYFNKALENIFTKLKNLVKRTG